MNRENMAGSSTRYTVSGRPGAGRVKVMKGAVARWPVGWEGQGQAGVSTSGVSLYKHIAAAHHAVMGT
jgi:hypothetical protein